VSTFENKGVSPEARQLGKDKEYNFCYTLDGRGEQDMSLLKNLLVKHEEWGCYFKVRRIYIQFTPNSVHIMKDLDEFLNEFGYMFGERISHLCFVQRRRVKERIFDNINEREVSRWNIVFVKVSGILHFLEFKFGFLKFSDAEIKAFVDNVEGKLATKKLINGSIKLIPADVYNYCIQRFSPGGVLRCSLPNIFEKSWRIVLKS
jgi:hypothetical protein